MKINKLNYESFLLDYSEGRLSSSQLELLKQFISQNPDLGTWEELTESLPVIDKEDVFFDRKSILYKKEIISTTNISEANFENFFIAFHENILSESEQAEVRLFLTQNPELKSDFKLFGLAKLDSNKTITFPQKDKIYQKIKIIPILNKSIAIAATLALFVGIAWFFASPKQQNREPLAEIQKIEMKKIFALEAENTISIIERDFQPIDFAQIPERESEQFALNTISPIKTKHLESISWTQESEVLYTQNINMLYFYFDKDEYLASISKTTEKNTKKTFSEKVKQNIIALAFRIKKAQSTSEKINNSDNDFLFKNITEKSLVIYSFLANKDVDLKKNSSEK